MPTLYRQYRPQRFADVFGQPHVTEVLQAAITKDQISHAYLFQGPRGTGKTSSARIFAKRLNCTEAKDAEPCGKCASCVATQAGKNIDVLEIDAASNRGIDNIRALREHSSLSPSMSKYKVYIIDEVHMLSHDAFPALLKTLEEPVAHVVFILATTELHKVPQTILSRCQVFRFRRASEQEMRDRLTYILGEEKREAQSEVLDFIISRSDGCYRDAESLLGQLLVMEEKNISLQDITQLLGLPAPTLINDFLAALIVQDLPKALELLDSAYSQGFDPEQFIAECIRMGRDTCVAIAKGEKNSSLAGLPNASVRLTHIIRALVQASADLAYVPQPLIALQLAMLSVCQTATLQKGNATPTPTPVRATLPPTKPQNVSPGVNVTTSMPILKKAAAGVTGEVAIIKGVWEKLIQAIKKDNPVASTFLRAVEPMEVNESEITVRVSYPLHRTFFEKPTNKSMVEKTLSLLLENKTYTIRCHMEGDTAPSATKQSGAGAGAEDASLYDSVKEVFGTA